MNHQMMNDALSHDLQRFMFLCRSLKGSVFREMHISTHGRYVAVVDGNNVVHYRKMRDSVRFALVEIGDHIPII